MSRGTVATAILLILAVVLGAYLHGSASGPGGSAVGASARHRLPVLMVHGSGMNSSVWTALMRHLRTNGWPDEYLHAVDLVPDDGANRAAAEKQLLPAANALLERASGKAAIEGWVPPRKLAVVGHSMGTVSARWLTAKLIPEQVAVFVAIAGANHGSTALCGRPGDGDRELCSGRSQAGQSVLLRELNGSVAAPADETPYGPADDPAGVASRPPTGTACIVWHAVMIDPDEWIVPAASARLAGSGGSDITMLPAGIDRVHPGEYVLRAPVNHDDLPAAPAVMSLVTSVLQAPAACP